ncbi:MAG TPA: hypothetical protein VII43_03490 [Opitutaceae bacterium]
MKPEAHLICLVTPGHVASSPRLVKEADALAEEGYRVHVVAGRHYPALDSFDEGLIAAARWQCTRVDYTSGWAVNSRKVLRRMARMIVVRPSLATVRIAARAGNAETLRLAAAAGRLPARLFVGHCLPGLPAAAIAARRRGTSYGFDAEDFHDGETDAQIHDPAAASSARVLQSALLPGCAHLTASAPLIGEQFLVKYRVLPLTVLNVFPRSHAPECPAAIRPISADHPGIIYWFSQTVGPGRGLEAVATILGKMRVPVELRLRGIPVRGYEEQLQSFAAAAGLKRPIQFLTVGAPDQMARLAAGAHLGLSTEERHPLNRDLCLTNKIFTYLLAGIPQLLSDTSAQRALAPDLGQAALLADLGQSESTARRLDEFLGDPERMAAAARAAWNLGQSRYSWDVEKSKFLASIGGALAPD